MCGMFAIQLDESTDVSKAALLFNHCMIHCQALAAKNMQADLHDVLKDVIKVVNFVKSSALNSQMFSKLCENMEAVHHRQLFLSEVQWLSRGKV